MRLVVVGTGYVGLISGVCLAAKGHDVTCVDINAAVVEGLNAGRPHIHELGLEKLLKDVLDAGRFRASAHLAGAMDGADLVLIAVGTPSENGVIDLSYVRAVAREIGTYLKTAGRHISVVVKSTVVPGTTDTVILAELSTSSGLSIDEFGLGMNPEFLREGNAIEDFMEPDRIVFGHEDPLTLERLRELYSPWSCDKMEVPTRTAEMIKYANNCMLALQISAMNEIANVATRLGGIDMKDVVQGVSLDKRWSPITEGGRITPTIVSYLVPGCGFGGSCFPKDVQALRSQGESVGLPMAILNAVLSVNDSQPQQVANLLAEDAGDLSGLKVLLLGLAFKPDTDDVRESASLKIAADLLSRNAVVTAHDPIAIENFRRLLGANADRIQFVHDWRAVFDTHENVIIATRWDEYRDIASCARAGQRILDVRRLLDPADLTNASYLTIGRRPLEKA